MENFVKRLSAVLESELSAIATSAGSLVQQKERATAACFRAHEQLKEFILEYSFTSNQEEILFFKRLKPIILTQVIYHSSACNILLRRPAGSAESQRKYLNSELQKLTRFFKDNVEFYQYIRSEATFLDAKYFLRGKLDFSSAKDAMYIEADIRFSTGYDYTKSQIQANELLQLFLQEQIVLLERPIAPPTQLTLQSNCKWTSSKTDLAELIYGLHAGSHINNGNADIKQIAMVFESIFNIELGDLYSLFHQMRSRKINRTKFLAELTQQLDHHMDESD